LRLLGFKRFPEWITKCGHCWEMPETKCKYNEIML
jgi:hypothetical protein